MHAINVNVVLLFEQDWHPTFFCFTICCDFMASREVREYENTVFLSNKLVLKQYNLWFTLPVLFSTP